MIDEMKFTKDDGFPALRVLSINDSYLLRMIFPLTNGFAIHTANEFLRSLDTGITVEFKTFAQYADLISRIFARLEK